MGINQVYWQMYPHPMGQYQVFSQMCPNLRGGGIRYSHKCVHTPWGNIRYIHNCVQIPMGMNQVYSQMCPHPVGQCLLRENQSLMWLMWPPWEHPWHHRNTPFTGRQLQYKDGTFLGHSHTDIDIIFYFENFLRLYNCVKGLKN